MTGWCIGTGAHSGGGARSAWALLGRHGIDGAAPVIARAAADGMDVAGPVPGQNAPFVKWRPGQYDAVANTHRPAACRRSSGLASGSVQPLASGTSSRVWTSRSVAGHPHLGRPRHGVRGTAGHGVAHERLLEAAEHAKSLAGDTVT